MPYGSSAYGSVIYGGTGPTVLIVVAPVVVLIAQQRALGMRLAGATRSLTLNASVRSLTLVATAPRDK